MHKSASLRWDRRGCTNIRLCVVFKVKKVGSYLGYQVINLHQLCENTLLLQQLL
ncbi:hypothetical protein [Candidatus Williamhamiltonella defendens]|uniref:hypothetical protein n=1 Tax=Candidatus Williamhamiltonella defendens TaxID=138072 RepID=UPI0016519026|nr:hypothetical protein [Candidatus Hamiltonella defensa]